MQRVAHHNVSIKGQQNGEPRIGKPKHVVGRKQDGERDGVVVHERFAGQVSHRPKPEISHKDEGVGDRQRLKHRCDRSEFTLAHVAENDERYEVAEYAEDGDGRAQPDLDDVPQEDDVRVAMARRRPGLVGVRRWEDRCVVWAARVADRHEGNVFAVHGPLVLGRLQVVSVGLRKAPCRRVFIVPVDIGRHRCKNSVISVMYS